MIPILRVHYENLHSTNGKIMFIYDYVMVTMATISFSLLLDVLTIVLRFVVSRANSYVQK